MTAALIVASGKRSDRDTFEPGRKVGSISAIRRIVLLFQQAGIRKILVCGEDEEVKKLVPSMNLVFLPAPVEGEMLDCIQMGIAYLQREAREILVCHVDIPLFSTQTLHALLDAEGEICVPSHQGKRGHPVLLRSGCFSSILAYQGSGGLKGAIQASGFHRVIVEVEDQGILSEVLESEAYKILLPDHDAGRLRLSCQLRIGREEVFYGPGVHQLLLLTQEHNSLADACKYMGVSYSKGRKIIQIMEEQTGSPVLITRQGGKGGGYSRLTEEAQRIICQYEAFQKEAEKILQALFESYFDP